MLPAGAIKDNWTN